MTTHEQTLINSIEKDKEDKEAKPKSLEVVRTEAAVLSDNSGSGSSDNADYNEFARPLFMMQPKLQAILTDHETICFGKQLGKEALNRLTPTRAIEPTRDIAEQRRLIKNKIQILTRDIANSRWNYGTNKNEWIQERKNCINNAKKAVGIHPRTEMDGISNIDALTKMKEYLDSELSNNVVTTK